MYYFIKLKRSQSQNLSDSRSLPTDVDECKNGSHDCHVNGTCLNTAGYFECVCNDGYFGDGHICTGWLQKIKVAVAVEVSIGKNAHTCDHSKKYLNCHYSQTRSSVPVTSKLMNSVMEK